VVPSVLGLERLFALFRRKSNFQFSIKAPRAIKHEGLLLPDRAQLNDFLQQADLLGKKLGSILFQLPPSLEFNAGRSTAFLTLFREMHNEDIAFEPRHESWFRRGGFRRTGGTGALFRIKSKITPELLPRNGNVLVYHRDEFLMAATQLLFWAKYVWSAAELQEESGRPEQSACVHLKE
jgi:uncharacterized protein YecE (DUF72 family)